LISMMINPPVNAVVPKTWSKKCAKVPARF
jgi:hypothetical protein